METQGTWTDADKAYTELHDALERLTDAAEAALVVSGYLDGKGYDQELGELEAASGWARTIVQRT